MKPQRYTATSSKPGCFQQHHLECISGCTEYSKLSYRLKYTISSSWVQDRSFTLNWELTLRRHVLSWALTGWCLLLMRFFYAKTSRLRYPRNCHTLRHQAWGAGIVVTRDPILCPTNWWMTHTYSQFSTFPLNKFWIEDSWKQFKLNIIFEPSRINTLTPLSLSVTQLISTFNAMDKNSESWQACGIRCWWHQLPFPESWMVKHRLSTW